MGIISPGGLHLWVIFLLPILANCGILVGADVKGRER